MDAQEPVQAGRGYEGARGVDGQAAGRAGAPLQQLQHLTRREIHTANLALRVCRPALQACSYGRAWLLFAFRTSQLALMFQRRREMQDRLPTGTNIQSILDNKTFAIMVKVQIWILYPHG